MPRAAAALLLVALLALPGPAGARACTGEGPLLVCDEGGDGAPDRATLRMDAPEGLGGASLDAGWSALLRQEPQPLAAAAGAALAWWGPERAAGGASFGAALAGFGAALSGGHLAGVPYVLHSSAGAAALASPDSSAFAAGVSNPTPWSDASLGAALACAPSAWTRACGLVTAALDARAEGAHASPYARWEPPGMPYACTRWTVAADACVEPWLP